MPEARQQSDEPVQAEPRQPVPVSPSTVRTPYWQTPLFRKVAAVLSLIAAAGIDYVLLNVPIGEVSGEFPAYVKARAEVVTVDNPGLLEGGPFSFEYRPRTEKEKILVGFCSQQLWHHYLSDKRNSAPGLHDESGGQTGLAAAKYAVLADKHGFAAGLSEPGDPL
jgi:hypothetical protein